MELRQEAYLDGRPLSGQAQPSTPVSLMCAAEGEIQLTEETEALNLTVSLYNDLRFSGR